MPENDFLNSAIGDEVDSLDNEDQNLDNQDNPDNTGNDDDFPSVPSGDENKTTKKDNKDDEGGKDKPNEGVSDEDLQSSADLYRETLDNIFSDSDNEDAKELKADLLKRFNGSDIDEDGNILDENGEVINTFEDVSKELAKDSNSEVLDDEGNLLDEEGNILKTAAEIKAENIEANKIAKNLGYSFKDEDGNDKIYSNGEKGVQELALDIAETENNKFKEEFINSNPVLAEVAKHLLAGHDLDTFNKPIDYTDIEVKGLSKDQKKDYLKKSFVAEGMSPERAERFAEGSKLSDEEVNEALQVLTTKEEETKLKRAEELKQIQDREEKENIEYWETVENTIKKGSLSGVKVPEKEQTEFFEYLSKPVEGQYSKDYINRQKQSTEDRLKEAYLRFKGYNLDDIIKEGTQKNKVSSLRQRMSKMKKSSSNSSSGTAARNKKGAGDITVDRLL